jgi:hypothetical protein
MSRKKVSVVLFAALASSLTLPAPSQAACNGGGCWSTTVDLLKIDATGKIWFVVADSASLANLVPADGCILRQIWTGQAEYALYVRTNDPDRDQKYAMLLSAHSTGSVVGFTPIKDAANNWCSLDTLSVD